MRTQDRYRPVCDKLARDPAKHELARKIDPKGERVVCYADIWCEDVIDRDQSAGV